MWSILAVVPALCAPRLGAAPARAVAFGAAAAWTASLRRRAVKRACRGAGSTPLRPAIALALGGMAGFAAYPGCAYVIGALGLALGLGPPPTAAAGVADPATALALVGLAPVFEEVAYRERLLPALRDRLGAGPALVASSAVFAASHLAPWPVLATFVVGLGFGRLWLATGSTAACIGLHAGLNAGLLCLGAPPRVPVNPLAIGLAWAALAVLTVRGLARPPHGRSRRRGAVLLSLVCLAPGAVQASALRFDGILSFVPGAPGLPSIALTGTGVSLATPSSGLSLRTLRILQAGIAGTRIAPVTDPAATASGLVALEIAASLGLGTFRPFEPPAPPLSAQLTARRLPVRGTHRLCLISSSCITGPRLALTQRTLNGTAGVGLGGLVPPPLGSPGPVSLLGAPWTVRTATLPVTTPGGEALVLSDAGWRHGAFSFTGSTAATGGALRLVTPVRAVSAAGAGPASMFARLTLTFVPEPGRAIGLGGAALALWILARSHPRPGRRS